MTPTTAAVENLRMWERIGVNSKVSYWAREVQRLTGKTPDMDRSAMFRANAEKSNLKAKERANANRKRVYDALTRPMITAELAEEIGMLRRHVTTYLRDLEGEGKVVRTGPHYRPTWERVA